MITSVRWVPRGHAASALNSRGTHPNAVEPRAPAAPSFSGSSHSSNESEPEMASDEEPDVAEVMAANAAHLMHNRRRRPSQPHPETDDDLLADDPEADEQEQQDTALLDSDWLLLSAAQEEDEVSVLEVYVYEHEEPDHTGNLYVHHDYILPAFPLCCAYSHYAGQCLAAVGTFLPTIDVWDLTVTDTLEPRLQLGAPASSASVAANGSDAAPTNTASNPQRRRRRQQPNGHTPTAAAQPASSDTSHALAVLALDFHAQQAEYLLSGSADATVRCWDLSMGECVATYRTLHTDKVQAVRWNPHHASAFASGGFDRHACVVDVRQADAEHRAQRWRTSDKYDVEAILWASEHACLVSDEGGWVSAYDTRALGDHTPVWRLRPHPKRPVAMTLCPTVPGMLVTGSTDALLQVYDVQSSAATPPLVASTNAQAGPIFSLVACPDSALGLAVVCGGPDGVLTVVDLAENQEAVRRWFHGRKSVGMS
ncbi:hypothetical protein CDCA_CDCA02G0490 [Cyanidium caldarium]|uniref:WD40 repeat-like protein n=1 Tax=Cyanidium caldarium TaxID=2771 RepID=A0AAV9IQW2_CYACA|nr:hypothetical protein CDCA_CDCA02G0490 [Cyanidium caldarium]